MENCQPDCNESTEEKAGSSGNQLACNIGVVQGSKGSLGMLGPVSEHKQECAVTTCNDLMYMPYKIRNGYVSCLVDSGASTIIMSLETCKKLKLED